MNYFSFRLIKHDVNIDDRMYNILRVAYKSVFSSKMSQ